MNANLNTLNALLVAADKKPLKAWKGSKATLEARIALETPTPIGSMAPPATPASIMSNVADEIAKGRAKVEVARKGAAPLPAAAARLQEKKARVAAKAKETKAIKQATMTTLADIARAAGVNPKVARAKVRRHAKKESWLRRSTWEFNASEAKKVAELLGTN